MNEQICASCYFFYPCPCGECSYGICGNTYSWWLHEYVTEDMGTSCDLYAPMSDEAKRAWAELSGYQRRCACGQKIYGYEDNGARAVLDACELRGDA